MTLAIFLYMDASGPHARVQTVQPQLRFLPHVGVFSGCFFFCAIRGLMETQPVMQSLALQSKNRKRLFPQYSQSFNKRANVIHRCNNPDLLKASSMQLLSIIGPRINRVGAEDPLSNTGPGSQLQWQHQAQADQHHFKFGSFPVHFYIFIGH